MCFAHAALAITVEGQLCATVWTTRLGVASILWHMCLLRNETQVQLLLQQPNQRPARQQLLQHCGKLCLAVCALESLLQPLVLYAIR